MATPRNNNQHNDTTDNTIPCYQYRYRVVLWTSGWMMVLSALVAAFTSSSSSDTIISQGPQTFVSIQATLSELFSFQKTDNIAIDNDDDNDDKENDFLIIHPDLLEDAINDKNEDFKWQQWHRRLKRMVSHHTNNHKAIKDKARERAKDLHPKKEYVSLMNDMNDMDNSDARQQHQEERMIFPSRDAERTYYKAASHFEDVAMRDLLDPLGESVTNTTTQSSSPILAPPQVPYLGVLVDAGRHYFPLPWLKRLIIYLHRLQFNMIHFRLTDDQAFNVRLKSYPQLAFASVATVPHVEWLSNNIVDDMDNTQNQRKTQEKKGKGHHHHHEQRQEPQYKVHMASHDGKVYTPDELKDLVAFAKQYNVVLIPEINLPGHAGAWAGIPDLIVNCPEFVCQKGNGIPLNVQHPQLKTILTGVIGEILEIFDNPPLLHLGGDEVFLSAGCFKELDREPFEYGAFEQLLQTVLDDLKYPSSQVLRWEETSALPPSISQINNDQDEQETPQSHRRTGAISHFWQTLPHVDPLQQEKLFVSTGLYFDTNHYDGAKQIYDATIKAKSLRPMGIVAGAFELHTDFWMQRNVAGRLIAAAMGAAANTEPLQGEEDFWNRYNTTCRDSLGLSSAVCDLQGFVAVDKSKYQREWGQTWHEWRDGTCDRLTDPLQHLSLSRVNTNTRANFEEANQYFWRTLGKPLVNRTLEVSPLQENHSKQKTTAGVLLDLVNSMRPVNHTSDILDKYIGPLGIRLVQLRIVDNHAFAIHLEHLTRVGSSVMASSSNPLPPAKDFANLVKIASEMGIEVVPEITLSTSAGGWLDGGFALNCPHTLCEKTGPERVLANNIGSRNFLAVAYAVIRELMETFTGTNFIHLGSDERVSNTACFVEDGRYGEDPPPFDAFERNLTHLLQQHLGMPTECVIRWENEEKVRYPDRTGQITHYRAATTPFALPKVPPGDPFFVTLDLLAAKPPNTPTTVFYEIYKNTRQLMAMGPMAILAEIRNMEETTFFTYSVGLRLISFSLGTRQDQDMDDLSPDEFVAHLVKECHRLKYEHCGELSKGTIDEPESPSYFVNHDYFRKRVCDKHAEILFSRKAKSEIH